MAYYKTLPSGKIEYYWQNSKNNPQAFLSDPIDGVQGVRQWLLDVIPDNESVATSTPASEPPAESASTTSST